MDNQLTLDWNGKVLPLQALKENVYFSEGSEGDQMISVGFLLEEEGPTQYILLDTCACQRIEPNASFTPDSTMWQPYVGIYASFGVDTLIVRIKDGRLYLYSQADEKEIPCIPLDATHFACEAGVIEFHLDDDGATLELGGYLTFKRVTQEPGSSEEPAEN